MSKLSRALLASLLLFSFGTAILSNATPAEARGFRRSYSRSTLPTQTSGYWFRYSEDGTLPSVHVIKTRRFWLYYPKTFESTLSREDVLKRAHQGFDVDTPRFVYFC